MIIRLDGMVFARPSGLSMHDGVVADRGGRLGETIRRGGVELGAWFLAANERGNPATAIDQRHPEPWTYGNVCRPLVHGRTYFERLHDELITLKRGDSIFFTDWRTDPDELLTGAGTRVADVLCRVARSGVRVVENGTRGGPQEVQQARGSQRG